MVSNKYYNDLDGEVRLFLPEFIIKSEQYCRVYNYVYDPNGVDGDVDPTTGLYIRIENIPTSADQASLEDWALVDNTVSFYEAPKATSTLVVEIATSPEELGEVVAGTAVQQAEDARDIALQAVEDAEAQVALAEDQAAEATAQAEAAAQSAIDAAQFDPSSYYTKTELNDGQLDTNYYTETEIDSKITDIGTDIDNIQTDINVAVPIDKQVLNYNGVVTYDIDGNVDYITFSTGNVINYLYTATTITSEEYTDTDGTTVLLTITYTYDVDGNLTNITRS